LAAGEDAVDYSLDISISTSAEIALYSGNIPAIIVIDVAFSKCWNR
jgi:hypothetical protein